MAESLNTEGEIFYYGTQWNCVGGGNTPNNFALKFEYSAFTVFFTDSENQHFSSDIDPYCPIFLLSLSKSETTLTQSSPQLQNSFLSPRRAIKHNMYY